MPSIPILFTFWPGLPQLWLHGRWSGLLNAIAFAGFLNFVLYATYQQTDLLPKSGLIGCWAAVGLFWSISIFKNDWVVKEYDRNRATKNSSKELDELFFAGQSEYLKGHLDEAENLFERVIRLNLQDLDARLYLATIYRHRGKLNQASRLLDELQDESQSEKWLFQIEDERKLIAELERELNGSKDSAGIVDQTLDATEFEDTLPENRNAHESVDESNRFAA